MKKYVVLFTACFLVGCPGPGDKFTPRFPAVVTAKDNHVCILSSMKAGDNIRFVQIYSESGDKLIKDIDNDAFFVEPGRCMPVFDYAFRPGKRYSVAYDIQTPEGSHLITAAFMVVSDERGNLRVND